VNRSSVLIWQSYKAHKEAVTTFTARIQQLCALVVKIVSEVSAGVEPPSQLESFKGLLEEAQEAIKVPSAVDAVCIGCVSQCDVQEAVR
jgi:hypothetical protein